MGLGFRAGLNVDVCLVTMGIRASMLEIYIDFQCYDASEELHCVMGILNSADFDGIYLMVAIT